jgi:hypothetical protein
MHKNKTVAGKGDSLSSVLNNSLRWHYPDQVKGSEQVHLFLSRVPPAPLIFIRVSQIIPLPVQYFKPGKIL